MCACVWKMLFLQPSEETCGLADQKKKKKRQKVIHLSEAVSLPNELYFYEGKHFDSNTFFIIFHNMFTPENDTPLSCSLLRVSRGMQSSNELTYSRHKPGMYHAVHEIINSLCMKEQLWKRPCISDFIRKKTRTVHSK